MNATHRVHCFGCEASYEQSGPHPQVCGSCGSRKIGVHSDPTGDVWKVALVNPDGTAESHTIQKSGVGELVQAIVDAGVSGEQVLVVTPPEAGFEASPTLPVPRESTGSTRAAS